MIESIPFEDERILGIRMTGKVELEDLLPLFDRLDGLLARETPLRAYVEIAGFEGVGIDALLKDLRYGLKHFRSLATRFERVAVVTDKNWIKNLARLESLLLPGTEERVFSEADAVEAMAWVSAK